MQITIEPMQRHHLEDVLCIEKSSFPTPWAKVDFEAAGASPEWSLYVALWRRRVVGYVAVETCLEHFQIWNLAVCEAARREGIGSRLVSHVVAKVGNPATPQACVEAIVRESSLDILAFFRACGFEARVPILKRLYQDTGEDGYVMQRKFCVTVGNFIDDELESAE